MYSFIEWLNDSSLATVVRESDALFPWLESVHVLALALVVGSIAIVDLRLLGVASRNRRISVLMKDVLPITWVAFIVALITGIALFASQATSYTGNVFFQLKMGLLVLLGLNVAVFHFMTARSVAQWDAAASVPGGVKFAGAASLLMWSCVVVLGRWIGFA